MIFSLPKDDPELVPVYIEHAILRYGHTAPELARDYMGEMAWFVVTETGGWLHTCGLNHDDLVHYRSVWRLVAKKILVIPKEDDCLACKGCGVDWHLNPNTQGKVYHCTKCNREFVQ